ncbi:MAG: transcriptional regulator, TrmB [uncultured bacterium]|nr:MAG: transcriptional regulator, TrmB [uncultured bacterium]
MSHIHKILQSLNFSPVETEIYLILAENEKLNVSAIIEKTQKSRTAVHTALNALLAKDFILYEKVGREAFYSLAHPHKLYGLLEEKKLDDARQYEDVSSAINSLVGSYQLTQNKPGVRFFEGIDGIMEVINDSLKAKGEILTYLDVEATQAYISKENKEYVQKRLELGIHKRMIAPDTDMTRERYRNYNPNIEVRLMPAHIKPFHTSVQIYNNSISFSTIQEEKMIGILIEDANIAQLHKSVFEFVWESLPPLTYDDAI